MVHLEPKCIGYDAFAGLDPSKIGCGSCHGDYSCGFTSGKATVSFVGENSCNGDYACAEYLVQVPSGNNIVIGKGSW